MQATRCFYKSLDFFADPFDIYSQLRRQETLSVLLESARFSEKAGRFSILAKNPFLVLEAKGSRVTLRSSGQSEILKDNPLDVIRRLLKRFSCASPPGGLPFTGGAIGYFGYEVKNLLEPRLRQSAVDDLGLPDAYLQFFDEGLIFDHLEEKIFIFTTQNKRRLDILEEELRSSGASVPAYSEIRTRSSAPFVLKKRKMESSLGASTFARMVQKAKAYIRRGDVFQANLSQRFCFPLKEDPLLIYENLKQVNPSPFFGFLDAGDFQILSGSPERLVKLEKGVLETRPIAGTRARGKTKAQDAALSLDLILSEKERAEHIMLVDLERNDMGRVAEYGSVSVDELMVLEDYSHVKHIVSNVRGILREGLDAIDVFRAFFPGGTITGTPKVRCMEIIDELEPVARGPYTGSLGYFGFNGNMDFNILIRSLVIKGGMAYLHAGAGIVTDSIPEKEYEETLCKAEGVLTAVFGKTPTREFFAKCRTAAGNVGPSRLL